MGRLDELMLIVAICQEYKWTYTEYAMQPVWFLHLVKEKMVRDNKEEARAHKKMNHGN